MNDTEQLKAALETDKIADALADYLQFEGARVLEESAADSQCKLTRKMDKRLGRVVRAGLRRQNPRYHFVRRSFIAAAVLLTLLATVYASAIRSTIANYFLDKKQESVDFSEVARPDQYTWDIGISRPTNIPSGYEFTKIANGNGIMAFIFLNPQKEEIRLSVYGDGTSVRIDSEGADEAAEIFINELPGYYIIKKEKMQLLWGKSPACLLQGPSKYKTALIGMAESIVYLPAKELKY